MLNVAKTIQSQSHQIGSWYWLEPTSTISGEINYSIKLRKVQSRWSDETVKNAPELSNILVGIKKVQIFHFQISKVCTDRIHLIWQVQGGGEDCQVGGERERVLNIPSSPLGKWNATASLIDKKNSTKVVVRSINCLKLCPFIFLDSQHSFHYVSFYYVFYRN